MDEGANSGLVAKDDLRICFKLWQETDLDRAPNGKANYFFQSTIANHLISGTSQHALETPATRVLYRSNRPDHLSGAGFGRRNCLFVGVPPDSWMVSGWPPSGQQGCERLDRAMVAQADTYQNRHPDMFLFARLDCGILIPFCPLVAIVLDSSL